MERVVGDEPLHTRSHSASTVSLREAAAGRLVQRGEERRAVRRAGSSTIARLAPVELAPSARRRRRSSARQVIGEVERDAAVALAERLDADPDDLAGRHQRVEIAGW